MFEDEVTYYRQRAETEVERAQKATKPKVVAAHYQLSEAYFDKLALLERPGSGQP